ncbi:MULTISPECIES: PIN domain-containing protein [Burkholderia]|uniref:PIN domain-containing protein n=1 Tax=Burkholderia TaxID=32008 RepID=UPI00064FAD45|nr:MULTISPECIES: PIN domain-containing protein [Burkholderia]KML15957.1 hypothetical protein VL00_13750 [Burkholderia cepacia]KML42220.1 hypothetical protein VL13_11115 [Burkholderia lata]KMN62266.1 hypothetical protein VK92_02895 [Burkholderia sp. LK4]
MDPRTVSLIATNQLGAIALDTSTFDAQHLNLEAGLLRRVEQFHRRGRVQVLMPDVVQREVLAHLARDAAKARSTLARAVRMAVRTQLLAPDQLAQLQAAVDQAVEPAIAAEARMAAWLTRTRAEVLDVGARVDVRSLFNRYFEARAPFADATKKKHEFPDAAALLTLEHWADEHDTAVLVVSADLDWQRFCADHPRLIWTQSLSDALSAFQDDSAQFAARRLAESIADGTDDELVDALFEAAPGFLNQIGMFLEVESTYEFGWNYVTHLQGFSWRTTNGVPDEVEAVDHRDGKVVVRVKGKLMAEIAIFVTFRAGTGAGEAAIPIGEKTIFLNEEIPCEALITLDDKKSDRFAFRDVEFLPTTFQVQLGKIDPDWTEPPDNRGRRHEMF